MPMRLGTGFFDLLQKSDDQINCLQTRKLLFDDNSLHNNFSYEIDETVAPRLQ